MNLATILTLLSIAVAALTFVVLASRLVRAIAHTAKTLVLWANSVEETLDYVRHEMSYDGGSTMRDAIKRIDERVAAIEGGRRVTDNRPSPETP